MQQAIEKKLFVSYIISFELVAVNCLYYKENTCHTQSVCEQTVLRFSIWLIETFPNQGFLWVLKKYLKTAVAKIVAVLGTL